MPLTTDPDDPRLGHGADTEPTGMNEVYLVLSDEERAKGFVRPVRTSYRHVGRPGPRFPLEPLSPADADAYRGSGYVGFERYPVEPRVGSTVGRYWTRAELDAVDQGCGEITTMSTAIAETYARSPRFYGSTYCATCRMHRPVGEFGEFVWLDGERVGT